MGPETARHEPHALISGIHHLKIPVTDLDASVSWWQDVTGARHDETLDHRTPEGNLFACVVEIPGAGPYLELRLDPAGVSAVASLDVVTFAVDTRSGLARLGEVLECLGIPHSPVPPRADSALRADKESRVNTTGTSGITIREEGNADPADRCRRGRGRPHRARPQHGAPQGRSGRADVRP